MSSRADPNWQRRLQGRGLEHGLVSVVAGTKDADKGKPIRMLEPAKDTGEKMSVNLVRDDSIRAAMLGVAEKLTASMAATIQRGLAWTKWGGRAYADQWIWRRYKNGTYAHRNLDLRLKLDDGVLWVEVKWGSAKFHRGNREEILRDMQKIAQSHAEWTLMLPGGGMRRLDQEKPCGVAYAQPGHTPV
jgi:hypothetical protein